LRSKCCGDGLELGPATPVNLKFPEVRPLTLDLLKKIGFSQSEKPIVRRLGEMKLDPDTGS